jgi:MarR family transcriptional regulator, organic hydroperoxide resistance regulator
MTTALLEETVPVGDTLEFLGVLWAVDHALQSRSKHMQATLGVTGPQRLVIRIVGRFPGIPAGQVAAILRLHASTVSGVLNRLEYAGFLQRRRDRRDRRRVLLGLTARGRRIDRDHPGTVENAVQQVLATTAPGAIESARGVLVRLAAALQPEVPRPQHHPTSADRSAPRKHT